VGWRGDAALAVTYGLLRRLSIRELVRVLTHEASHIRADDVRIMDLSDTVGRLTHGLGRSRLRSHVAQPQPFQAPAATRLRAASTSWSCRALPALLAASGRRVALRCSVLVGPSGRGGGR
jgi:Zn-dependent protease with chaperone function